jgi:cyclic lactone autoinducer peptide
MKGKMAELSARILEQILYFQTKQDMESASCWVVYQPVIPAELNEYYTERRKKNEKKGQRNF